MAISLSTAAANGLLETGYDSLFNSAILELRSGTRPADANTAPTGTLLASGTIPADAFAAATGRAKAKNGTWTLTGQSGAGTGTNVTWYRLRLSGDAGTTNTTDVRQDGTVTVTGGGGDLTLDNVNVANGQTVTVNTFSISIP